ncbi:RNA polymerase sigma factor [Patescibacteria group bacterium]
MEISETKIIEQCQKGDLTKFSSIYDRYIKKIYNFIYYKTLHKETAEDIASNTFFKALQNIKKFDSDKGSFSSWLYRIARNTVIDHYRSKKNDIDIEDVWGLSSDDDIASDIEIKENLDKVKEYLEKFKPLQREIIIMRLWDGLSYQEISEITDTSVGSCKMTFSRAIKKLREEISLILLLIVFAFYFRGI